MQNDVSSSGQLLQSELANRIVLNDDNVFRRLRIHEVAETLVNACAISFVQDNATAITTLKALEQEATGRNPSKKEREMYEPLAQLLYYIRNFRDPTDPASAPALSTPRVILSGLKLTGNPTGNNFYFPSETPAFSAVAHGDDNESTRYSWSVRDWILEVKATRAQSPSTVKSPSAADNVIVQCSDYARSHMSSRPFFLFSVGVTIAGSEVCAAIFDRDGVTISRPLLLWDPDPSSPAVYMDAVKDFIRLIRSLTHICSLQDLGQDPTVVPLGDHSIRQQIEHSIAQDRDALVTYWTSSASELRTELGRLPLTDESRRSQLTPALKMAEKQLDIAIDNTTQLKPPSFVVSLGDHESRRWCTLGAPIWSSLSFIGRGTSVWRVKELIDGVLVGPELILKNAWRTANRISETSIYDMVDGSHPGLAVLHCGSDVHYPRPLEDSTSVPITVYGLRGTEVTPGGRDLVLHRIVLETVGRALWKYKSDLELVKGMRSAVEAHRFLSDQGILHRDISAGNILLSTSSTPPAGHEGFLTDLELARTGSKIYMEMSKDTGQVLSERITGTRPVTQTQPMQRQQWLWSTKLVEHKDVMTGTAQYMALEVLTAGIYGSSISQQPCHDLESFLLVLSYCVLKHTDDLVRLDPSIASETITSWIKLCRETFGHTTLHGIQTARTSATPFFFHRPGRASSDLMPLFETFISEEMRRLLRSAGQLVAKQLIFWTHDDPEASIPLTYDSVFKLFDNAIKEMELAADVA